MWDISWHRTIHRVRGACGWHVLRTTFGPDADARSATVRFWGFRGPLGAWVCIWGALAMIVSAPFDDWWRQNVAPAGDRRLSWLFAYAAGLLMVQVATLFMERIAFPNTQHSPQFFFICAVTCRSS